MSPALVADYTLRLPDKEILRDKLRELTELAWANDNADDFLSLGAVKENSENE